MGGTHISHLLIVERTSTKNHNYNTMAAIAAPINAGLAGLPVNAYGLAGLPLAGAHGLALNAGFYANHGLVHHALPAQAPLVQGAPLQYVAQAPVLKAAPLVASTPSHPQGSSSTPQPSRPSTRRWSNTDTRSSIERSEENTTLSTNYRSTDKCHFTPRSGNINDPEKKRMCARSTIKEMGFSPGD